MRGAVIAVFWGSLVSLVSLASACDAKRDLSEARFACGSGGPCDGNDAGVEDAGASGDGGAIDANVPCDPLFARNPCGGDPVGEYEVVGACSSRYVFEDFLTSCPGAQKRGQKFTVEGTLSVQPTDLSAECTLNYEERMFVPNICAAAAGGCSGLNALLSAEGLSLGECVVTNGGCDCTAGAATGCIESGPYTTNDARLTVNTQTNYEYCQGSAGLMFTTTELDAFDRRTVFVTRKVR